MNFFSKKPPATIGLDISPGSVRLVELDRDSYGDWVLERVAVEALPTDSIGADGTIEKFEEVVDAIRQVVKKSGTRAKYAAAALPASAVIAKKVVLPEGLSEDEIDRQVEGEAAQYVPFSLDEVSLDYYSMGSSSTSVGDEDIMIVATRKERVEDMIALMEAAKLKLKVLDVASYASQVATQRLVGGLHKKNTDALVALVHIGYISTRVYVMRNSLVIFEREQPIGGLQLTQKIARVYGMTEEEAESKKISGQLPDDYGGTVLKPFVERLAQEIQTSLQFFYNSTPYNKVDYVFLSGGSAVLAKLTKTVGDVTSTTCLLANPFDGMTVGPHAQDRRLRHEAPAFLTASGLAMRRFSS